MRISEKQVMQLLSILDGTITDEDLQDENVGGWKYDDRLALWNSIHDQQSTNLIDLEHGGRVQAM